MFEKETLLKKLSTFLDQQDFLKRDHIAWWVAVLINDRIDAVLFEHNGVVALAPVRTHDMLILLST
jgi:hypothetical protein